MKDNDNTMLDPRRIEVMDEVMAEVLRRKTPAERWRSDSGSGDRLKRFCEGNWRRCIRNGMPSGLIGNWCGGCRMGDNLSRVAARRPIVKAGGEVYVDLTS